MSRLLNTAFVSLLLIVAMSDPASAKRQRFSGGNPPPEPAKTIQPETTAPATAAPAAVDSDDDNEPTAAPAPSVAPVNEGVTPPPVVVPVARRAAAPAAITPVDKGVAFEVRLKTAVIASASANGMATSSTIGGGIFAGYKSGRLVLGIGLDFGYGAASAAAGQGVTGSTSGVGFSLVPGVRVTALRSENGRLELNVQADLGLGGVFGSTSTSVPGVPATSTQYFNLSWDAGPAIRYWVASRLAVHAFGGLTGTHLIGTVPSGIGTTSAIGVNVSLALLAIY